MNDEELEISEPMVQIPMEEYRDLLDTDSRMSILKGFYRYKGYVLADEMLLILGMIGDFKEYRKKLGYTE